MANISYEANNCVLEVGTTIGSREISSQEQVGTETITKYEGCVDINDSKDEGFNDAQGNTGQRVVYTGNVPTVADNLGGTLQECYGVGNIQTQGCALTYLNTFGNNSFQPGSNQDDDKLIVFNLYDNNLVPINMPSINPDLTAGGARYEPKNGIDNSHNPQGRAIYFVNNDNTSGTGANVTDREVSCFDIVHDFANNNIVVRGNGSDRIVDYTTQCNQLWLKPENHSYYISAYKHSGAWDSSGGSNNPFYWVGGSIKAKTHIGSYEGSIYRNPALGTKINDCFNSDGLLGITSQAFGMGAGLESADQYEVKISVSSIINANINVFEGSPYNSQIETGQAGNLRITSPGVYSFCLGALKRTHTFGNTATYGGVIMMDNGKHFHTANGSINILEAVAINEDLPARCTIDFIEITKKDTKISSEEVPVYVDNSYTIDDIQWEYLDIFKSDELPIALTYTIGNLKDLSKSNTGYSKTFKIPSNNRNNQILDPMLAVGAVRENIDWKPCRISVDGVVVFKGLIRVEKGITGNGGAYSCHILEDSIDWASLIDDRQICDIAFGDEVPKKKGWQSILTSWFHTPHKSIGEESFNDFKNDPTRNLFGGQYSLPGYFGETEALVEKDYIYGLINYGEWYGQSLNGGGSFDYSHGSNDFHPSIFAYRVVNKIFENIGYTLQSNFFESDTFKRLVHPYSSGEEYIDTDVFGDTGSAAVHVAREVKTPCGGQFETGGKVSPGNTHHWYPPIVPGSDEGNNWGGNSAQTGFTAPFTGNYYIGWGLELYISTSLLNDRGELFAEIMINGTLADPNYIWNSGLWAKVQSNNPGVSNGLQQSENTTIFLNQGDVVSLRIRGVNPTGFIISYSMWCDVSHMLLDIYALPSANVPELNVNLNKILPCTKQKDYLKGLTELFNLQWLADRESRTVTVEPYDEFFGSGKVLDWTDKLDHTSWTDKFIAEELARDVLFKYKKDSGDKGIESLYNWREENGYDIYKSYELQNEQRFRKERLELGTTIFHSTYRFNNYGNQPNPSQYTAGHPTLANAYQWGDLTWTDPFTNKDNPLMPVIWTKEGGHINQQLRPEYTPAPKSGIRILNYYGITKCSKWRFSKADGSSQNMGVYPHLGWINGWSKGVAIDPYNLSWDDYDDGSGFVSPGLFSKYWKNAFNKMTGGAAVRTCQMALSPVDINLFDYRDIIHLKIDGVSTYWTVQAIKDYKPNQRVLTTVELIEWKQDNNYVGNSTKKTSNKIDVQEEQDTGKGYTAPVSPVSYEPKSNLQRIEDAITVTDVGDIKLYGGEIIVEEENGMICTLVYTDGDCVEKLYLPKQADDENTNNNKINYNK